MSGEDQKVPVAASPAIGYSITASLGDRRQIVIQHFVGADETDADANKAMDRIMGFVDRLQAVYDIDAELEGFHKVGMTLAHTVDALPLAARQQAKQVAELKAKLEGQIEGRRQVYEDGYADHTARGGRGTYEPKGAKKQQLAAADAQIETTKKALEAVPNDSAQHKQEVLNSISRFQEDLRRRRVRVNHLLGLLGKPPVTDYASEEAFKPD